MAVLCVISALIGGNQAYRSWRYLPATPPNGCALLRPETVDIVVPGHDPIRPIGVSFFGDDRTLDANLSFCEIESATTTLGIAIWHMGRGPAGGPLSQARDMLADFRYSMALEGMSEPGDLGDESVFGQTFLSPGFDSGAYRDKVSISYVSRVGSYVSVVFFGSADPMTFESALDTSHAVLQEVLSRL